MATNPQPLRTRLDIPGTQHRLSWRLNLVRLTDNRDTIQASLVLDSTNHLASLHIRPRQHRSPRRLQNETLIHHSIKGPARRRDRQEQEQLLRPSLERY